MRNETDIGAVRSYVVVGCCCTVSCTLKLVLYHLFIDIMLFCCVSLLNLEVTLVQNTYFSILS